MGEYTFPLRCPFVGACFGGGDSSPPPTSGTSYGLLNSAITATHQTHHSSPPTHTNTRENRLRLFHLKTATPSTGINISWSENTMQRKMVISRFIPDCNLRVGFTVGITGPSFKRANSFDEGPDCRRRPGTDRPMPRRRRRANCPIFRESREV